MIDQHAAPTPENLEREANALLLPRFDLASAVQLGQLALARALDRNLSVTIEIQLSDRVAFRAALPGTSEENDDWLKRKFRVVHIYRKSSLAVWADFEARGIDFNEAARLSPTHYAAVGGGWPIMVNPGTIAGLFGVSGLPHIDDHQFIVETLRTYLSNPGGAVVKKARNSRSW